MMLIMMRARMTAWMVRLVASTSRCRTPCPQSHARRLERLLAAKPRVGYPSSSRTDSYLQTSSGSEPLGNSHLSAGGAPSGVASVVNTFPCGTPAAIGATHRSVSEREPPPAKRHASQSPSSRGSLGRDARNSCEGFGAGERRGRVPHSFLATTVQMSQASEALGTLGEPSGDDFEFAEPRTPLSSAIGVRTGRVHHCYIRR